jgi:membrane protein implicated in regulation of membrane protease activity
LSEIERATEQRLREIERARAEQLDLARSWILLFTLAAMFGLWWVFYNQLKLDFYVSWLLGFVVALVLRRILSFYVGMHLGRKYARQLKDRLLGR